MGVNITYSTSFQFEVEGTFESGILAAAWNPDESVVAIVTGTIVWILFYLNSDSFFL